MIKLEITKYEKHLDFRKGKDRTGGPGIPMRKDKVEFKNLAWLLNHIGFDVEVKEEG